MWGGEIPCHPVETANLVYIEVPKAGCTSIKYTLSALRGGPPGDHEELHRWLGYTHASSVGQLRDWLGGRWRGFDSFTVVRHPVERFESFYWAQAPHERGAWGDINRYVLEDFTSDDWSRDIHLVPQTLLLGGVRLTYTGRTEQMHRVQRWLSRRVGPVQIPHLNQSDTERVRLSHEARERLTALYRADMEAFGYE